jgi:hypothetical protein
MRVEYPKRTSVRLNHTHNTMIFIPAKQSDYNRLTSVSRKSSSLKRSAANFVARERDIIVGNTRAVVNSVRTISPDFSNTRLVYSCGPLV